MTPTPPTPQQDWIISEKLTKEIEKHLKDFPECISLRIPRVIRSRPYTPTAPASIPEQDAGLVGLAAINGRLRILYPDDFALQLNEQQLKQQQQEHDAVIAAKATTCHTCGSPVIVQMCTKCYENNMLIIASKAVEDYKRENALRTHETCGKHFSCPDGEECWYSSADYYWDCGDGATRLSKAARAATLTENKRVLDEAWSKFNGIVRYEHTDSNDREYCGGERIVALCGATDSIYSVIESLRSPTGDEQQ